MALLLLSGVVVYLALGWQPADEKARDLQRLGLTLQADNNEQAAVSAFRNALTYDPDLNETRRSLALTLLARGDTDEAQTEFGLLSEHLPNDFPTRENLTWLAMLQYDWAQAKRQGNEAIRISPASLPARAIANALTLHGAQLAGDWPAIEQAVVQLRLILSEAPENLIARWSVIEAARSGPRPYDALPDLDIAIDLAPRLLELETAKLSIYSRAGDRAGGGAQLQRMFAKFPGDANIRKWLFEWYLAVDDTEGALGILRFQAAIADDKLTANRRLVDFARNRIGPQAALDELQALAKQAQGTPLSEAYLADAASITFDTGRKAEAVAMLEGILSTATPSDQSRDITMSLAHMLVDIGRTDDAKQRVADILADDPAHVQALKMNASWLIDVGKAEEALSDLRVALSQDANDESVLILMATAYRELGASIMEGEMLRQAVKASANGVAASGLLYQFQIRSGRSESAATVLEQSLTSHPDDMDLLQQLAADAISRLEWRDAERYIGRLRAVGRPDALLRATRLAQASLLKRERADATEMLLLATIRSLAGEPALAIQQVRSKFAQGRISDARRTLREELAKRPGDSQLLLLQASLLTLDDEIVE